MNLIEQLGGYDEAKKCLSTPTARECIKDELRKELLEYRRENNIFEEGDKIVHIDKSEPSRLYTVKNINARGYDYGNDWGWYGVNSNMGVDYTFRHATDDEIKAGHRI